MSTPDLSRWTRRGDLVERADGAREHVLVGRHRFATHASLSARSAAPASVVGSSEVRSSEERALPEGGLVVEGIASSTSVDSYGTEMSLDALRRMAEQMEKGVPLLPRHNNGMRAVEWDEVIGRTVGAKIEAASVAAPGGTNEPGYSLSLASMLYPDEPLAASLVRRLERGEPIGQSIGGWFLSVRVVERGGEVERVIVEEVELDHVAVTRAPANPDAIGMVSLRSSLAESLAALPSEQRGAYKDEKDRDGDYEDDGDAGSETGVSVKVVVEGEEEDEDETSPEQEDGIMVEGAACPVATSSASVNLANRAKAIEVANYGPANPDEPGDYWRGKAERLGGETTEEQASAMRCGNCSYFNVSSRMKACIAAGIGDDGEAIVEHAGLGFCEAFDFKCAAARTCDGWVVGGPMVDEAPSEEQAAARRLASSDRASAGEVREGDFVRFLAATGVSSGQVKARATEGDLDGVQASVEDPALRVEVYSREGDGYVPSGTFASMLTSKVERIDPLPLPATTATVDVETYSERMVVEFSDFPPAPRDEEWVWGADEQNAVLGDPPDWSRYETVHLYVDPEARETKDGYKLPIASLYDGSLHVFYRAVVAAMAVLNGARGGIPISDADRRSVYENLVRYYAIFDEEAPPLAERSETETDLGAGTTRSSLDEIGRSVVGVRRGASTLDVTALPRHDTLNHAGGSPSSREAGTGSDRTAPTLPYEDHSMNNDEIKQMIERAVEAALASRAAPVPTPVDEKDALRSENEILRTMVGRLSAAPVRRGLAYQTSDVTGAPVRGRSALHDLVERSRTSSPGVAQVIDGSLALLVGDKAERATASELHSALATALRAAEAEGLLGNPAPAHWA